MTMGSGLESGTRDPLRKKQPPRDDVAVPSVDDHLDVLIEQVAVDDSEVAGHFEVSVRIFKP